MSVTIKYFASLREILGRSEDKLELKSTSTTVADLWSQINNDQKSLPPKILSAINMEYVKPDALVRDGDEVAFFPPVTGG